MRATRVQAASNQAAPRVGVKHAQAGFSLFSRIAIQVHHGHAQPISGVAANRCLHVTVGWPFPRFCGQRQILAAHRAGGNHVHQCVHATAGTRNHHQAAGVFVKPMDDARSRDGAGERIQTQQGVEQGSAPVARRWVHNQASGLVDNQKMVVAVDNVQCNVLSLVGLALRGGPQLNSSHRANLHSA